MREISTSVIIIRPASVARQVSQRGSTRTRNDSISLLTKGGGVVAVGFALGATGLAGVSDFSVRSIIAIAHPSRSTTSLAHFPLLWVAWGRGIALSRAILAETRRATGEPAGALAVRAARRTVVEGVKAGGEDQDDRAAGPAEHASICTRPAVGVQPRCAARGTWDKLRDRRWNYAAGRGPTARHGSVAGDRPGPARRSMQVSAPIRPSYSGSRARRTTRMSCDEGQAPSASAAGPESAPSVSDQVQHSATVVVVGHPCQRWLTSSMVASERLKAVSEDPNRRQSVVNLTTKNCCPGSGYTGRGGRVLADLGASQLINSR
jgi:hypothetical protein